ncbi:hypothetical protein [Sorangium sp. So ce131]|uniref:hypothetical protein n=1 Tax=Sorangium sp. So ce131 TaxID=3133282 RepID=UPI003F643BA2
MIPRRRRLVIAAALAAASPACAGATAEERSHGSPRPPAPTAPAEPTGRAAPGAPHATTDESGPGEARATTDESGPGEAHTAAGESGPGEAHTAAGESGPGEARAGADAAAAPAPERSQAAACAGDADCGYDPANERCGSDPRLNRQPPLTDQGIVCYCEAGACALLRVVPVPCEGDHSCAVAHEPRPHPVRATRERPHEKGRPCRDFTLSTTCERTNICTLRRHVCPAR